MRTRIFSAREYVSTEHDLRAGDLSWGRGGTALKSPLRVSVTRRHTRNP